MMSTESEPVTDAELAAMYEKSPELAALYAKVDNAKMGKVARSKQTSSAHKRASKAMDAAFLRIQKIFSECYTNPEEAAAHLVVAFLYQRFPEILRAEEVWYPLAEGAGPPKPGHG
jgi:hypothetical protein